MCEAEVWVVVDEDGNYAAGVDREAAWAAYTDAVGWDESAPVALRWVQCTVKVPLPKPCALTGTAPADGNKAELMVK